MIKQILEKILTARIDRALDDGKPLDGLTRRFVLRNEKLRRYYESMLALELELRFPLDNPPPTNFVQKRSESFRTSRRSTLSRTIAVISLGVAVLLCAWFAFVPKTDRYEVAGVSGQPSIEVSNPADGVLWETLASISPLDWNIPSPDPIDVPFRSLMLPSTEPICEFSDRPIESTATLLMPLTKLFASRSGHAEPTLEN